MTTPKGSKGILVAREKENGNLQFASFMVDVWKMGLKDCFGKKDVAKSDFNKIVAQMPQYAEADLEECKEIIKQGVLITESLGLKIPKGFSECKYILGDLDSVEVTGSLYKCFECGKGNLPDEIVEQIKTVTLHDVAAGSCGTEDETMIYFVCEDCKKVDGKKEKRKMRRKRRGRRREKQIIDTD